MVKASRPHRIKTFPDNYRAVLIGLAALLLTAASVDAQIYTQPNKGNYGTGQHRGFYDSTLFFPTGCGVPTDATWLYSEGFNHAGEKKLQFALYGDSCGNKAYLWIPSLQAWQPIGQGSGIDTLYARGDSAFYKKGGTEYFAFILGSGGSTDTTSLSDRINGKKDKSDSVSLAGYSTNANRLKLADSLTAIFNSLFKLSTDSVRLSGYTTVANKNKLADSLTANFNALISAYKLGNDSVRLSGYTTIANKNKLADSLTANFNTLLALYKLKSDSVALGGFTTVAHTNKVADSLRAVFNTLLAGKTDTGSKANIYIYNQGTGVPLLSAHDSFLVAKKLFDTARVTWKQRIVGTDTSVYALFDTTGLSGVGGSSVANSTGIIGLTRITGSATTAKRSDAADPVDTTQTTGVTPYHDLNDSARVLKQAIQAVYPNESPVGEIFYAPTFQNNLSFFGVPNSSGTAAMTSVSGYPILSSTNINWLNTITELPDRPTMLSNTSDTMEVQIVSTATGTVAGMGPAILSTNTSSPLSVKCYIQTQTSGNGTITMATHTGGVTLATASGCTNAVGDVLRFILSVTDSSISFSSLNLTTGTSATCTTTYSTATNGNIMPNIGNWGFVIHGPSSFRLLRQHIVSTAKRFPYVLAAGDSKFVGIGGTKFGTGPERTLGRSFGTTTYYSGAGSTAADFLKLKQEVLMLNPPYILYGYGSNSLRFGATLAQTEADIIKAAGWWKGTGTKFIMTIFPEDSTAGGIGMTDLKNWMANSTNQNTYGFTYVDCWTTLTGGSGNICVSPFIASDHIHLTDAGYAAVNPLLIAAIGANPIRKASPRTYSQTLVPIGDSLTTTYSVSNRVGYILMADSNLNLIPSAFQQQGNLPGVSALGNFIPASGSTFSVNGQVGSNGPNGGWGLYDRLKALTALADFGIYDNKNNIRFFTTLGYDGVIYDSSMRFKIGNLGLGQTVVPKGWIDIAPSDGAAGHASFIIEPGIKTTAHTPGALENDSTTNHLIWTDKSGTQYQLDQQAASIPPNIGTGYRVYAPQIPGFKSVVFVNGSIDSTSTSNVLTFKSGVGQGASDADYTATNGATSIALPVITANRTLTVPNANAANTGAFMSIMNNNTAAFTWNVATGGGAGQLRDMNATDITTLLNKTIYFFTNNGNYWILTGTQRIVPAGFGVSGSYSSTGTATTTFTVTTGVTEPNSTYKVVVTPTDALAAGLFYVTNKTATTFDVVYLSGLTGVVSFDWIVSP